MTQNDSILERISPALAKKTAGMGLVNPGANLVKYTRHKDPQAIADIRAIGICELCGKPGTTHDPLDVHHIKTRGSGGGDYKKKMVLIHRSEHQLAHAGKIKKEVLFAIAEARK